MQKHGLKVLSLAIMAALALMAFSASAAQAVNLKLGDEPETGEAGFVLSGGTTRPTGAGTETVSGTLGAGRLLIPAKSSEIACEKATLTGIVDNEYENFKTAVKKKGGHGTGTVLFEGCKVFPINAAGELNGAELTACTKELTAGPQLAEPEKNHHITTEVLILVKKHEISAGVFRAYLILEPLISSKAKAEEAEKLTLPFVTLKFGGECSLPATVNVTGSVGVEAPASDANEPAVSVDTFGAAGKAVQELLGTGLKFGANPAFIVGSGKLKLTGTGAALSWGAM